MKALQREDVALSMRLRGPCAEAVEPTLELCMKIQRKPALTEVKTDAYGIN